MFIKIPAHEYHTRSEISASMIKSFDRACPLKWALEQQTVKSSEAMAFGSAAHCALLEPELFDLEYAVAPRCDRRTKDGKALWADFLALSEGKTVLTEEQGALCFEMASAVRNHPVASKLLEHCNIRESAIFWEREGVKKRALFDAANDISGIIVDYKTTDDASPAGFIAACRKYGYHLQDGHYREAIETNGLSAQMFFIMQEKQNPQVIGVYSIDGFQAKELSNKAHAIAAKIQDCFDSGVFAGYTDLDSQTIELPNYLTEY